MIATRTPTRRDAGVGVASGGSGSVVGSMTSF